MIIFTNPDLLSLGNKTTLRSYTTTYSAAGAIARGLLSLSDEFFPLDFVLPNDSLEVRSETNETETSSSRVVYPNPSNGLLKVNLPSEVTTEACSIVFYDIIGKELLNKSLSQGLNQIDLDSKVSSGVLIYTIITEKGTLIKSGKLIITK